MARKCRWSAVAGVAALVGALVTAGCGGGGGGGGGGGAAAPAAVTLTGTAAKGAAIAGANVVVKDRNGTVVNATTDANGGYTADVTGLTAPFLVQITLSNATVLYSVAEQTGTCNITPLTDLIVRTYYQVQSTTADAAFANLSAATVVPTVTEVQVIEAVVETTMRQWLLDAGIDPETTSLITTPFTANNTGLDAVLEQSTVSADGTTLTVVDPGVDGIAGTADDTTQTSTVVVNANTDTTTVNTTTTSPTGTSTSTNTTTVPTTSAMQQAVDAVTAGMLSFKNAVNAAGANLADTDLLPFTDANLLDEGQTRAVWVASVAGELRGATISDIAVSSVVSFDEANGLITVNAPIVIVANGVTSPDEFRMTFKKQADGSWLFYGNQEIAQISFQFEMRTDRYGNGQTQTNGPRKSLNVDIRAPIGTVASVSFSGWIYNNQAVPKDTITETETLHPTPTTDLVIQKDAFFFSTFNAPLTDYPPAGTAFTVTVTTTAGPVYNYTLTSNGTTTDPILLTSPTGTTIADATPGTAMTATWTLPTSFSFDNVRLTGIAFGSVGSQRFSTNLEDNGDLAPTATSGQITCPTTFQTLVNGVMTNVPVDSFNINLTVDGPNGERTIYIHQFGNNN